MGVQPQFALSNRAAIEAEIERLIALLDEADGDCDLEPETDFCPAGDDGCGEFWLMGNVYAGYQLDDGDHSCPIPRYGIDQTKGPINEREVYAAWRRRLTESNL